MTFLPSVEIEGIQVPKFHEITPQDWDNYLAQAWNEGDVDGALIASNPEEPTFNNTFKAMELRQQRQWRILSPFITVQTADNTPEMQALAEKWLPKFDEQSVRFMDAHLADRCRRAMEHETDLDAVDQRLASETIKHFQRSGAFLVGQDRDRFLAIRQRLSELGLEFSSIHQDNSNVPILVDGALPGVDAVFAEQARQASPEPGMAAITMKASEVDTILAQCDDRDVREQVWHGFAGRGTGQVNNDRSTQDITREILALRHEQATLLGHSGWGDFAAQARMAGKSSTAMEMVESTWKQLSPVLSSDLARVASFAREQGQAEELAPWDLDYWLGKVRQADFAVDEDHLKQFLALPLVRAGAFATAETLFGVSFEPVDAPTYHHDAKPFLVRDTDGSSLGLLYIDDAIRPTKSSGAWMEQLLPPDRLDGHQKPIVINVCNFPSPTPDRPALLSMDEAVTAFHELGHALHALLTTARYPSHSGVMVYGDFVELQSQLLENWIREPEALSRIGRHWETGESMSLDMAQQVARAMQFGESFAKARYLMSAWLDLAAHAQPSAAGEGPERFEAGVLASMQANEALTPRHRLPHFTHLFGGAMGEGYSAGYYSYLWAEVLEADAFEAFREGGNLFDENLGRLARQTIYGRGNEVDPAELYRSFRGRDPDPAALLRRLGAAVETQPTKTPKI